MQLIEVYIPKRHFEKIDEKLRSFSHQSYWISNESDERMLVRILVETKQAEKILNYIEETANVAEGFEAMLIPVQTYLSRETIKEKELEKDEQQETEKEKEARLLRASRHELIQTIEEKSFITLNYTLLVILSAIVATVGFIKNSEAVVIGAMVIAPMIGPVISMAFSAILGDYQKLGKSTLTSMYGFSIVIAISVFFSYFFGLGTDTDQYLARTEVTLSDFFLALASGAAGALSILNRLSGNLVGVMVAVALLPPTVAFGLSIGQGLWGEAYGSLLLIVVNFMCILLAAVIIFSISGIRPVRWMEVKRANTSRFLSLVFISIMVGLLILVILFGQDIKFE